MQCLREKESYSKKVANLFIPFMFTIRASMFPCKVKISRNVADTIKAKKAN